MRLKTKRNKTKKIPPQGVGRWTLGVCFISGDNLLQGVVVNEAWGGWRGERRKGGQERKILMMLSVTLTTTWSN